MTSRFLLRLLLLLHPSFRPHNSSQTYLDSDTIHKLVTLCQRGHHSFPANFFIGGEHIGENGMRSLSLSLLQLKSFLSKSKSKHHPERSKTVMDTHLTQNPQPAFAPLRKSSTSLWKKSSRNGLPTSMTCDSKVMPSHLLLRLFSMYEASGEDNWKETSVAIDADLHHYRSIVATVGLRKDGDLREIQTVDSYSKRRRALRKTSMTTVELSFASSLSAFLSLLLILWLFSYITVYSFYS